MPRERHQQLRQLHPLHLVGATSDGLPVEARRRRGRPRQVVAVAPDQTVYDMKVREQLGDWIAADDVVRATARGETPASVMSKILEALAVESAALAFDRQRAAREGRDISDLAGRRVRALGRLAELALLQHQLDGRPDLDGPVIAQIEQMWMSMVQEVAAEIATDPEAFVGRVREAMVGWQGRLRPPAPGQR